MKKHYTLVLTFLITTLSLFSQNGQNHYQSLSLTSWYPKTGNKILLPVSGFSGNKLEQYDLSDDSHTLLNDSAKPYGYATMNGDTGVAYGSSPFSYAYYTHDNWATYQQTVSNDGVGIKKMIKTSTGFLGYKEGSSSNRITISHSTNGVVWTASVLNLSVGSIPYHYMKEINGKTLFISGIANSVQYRVSYDGGQTFAVNTMVGPPPSTSQLKDLVAFDTINMLADMSTYVLNYSTNGGQTWVSTPSYNLSGKRYLYATGLDSIYYSKASGIDSIFLSTDTGQTYSYYSQNLPNGLGYGSRFTKYGNYIIGGTSYAKDINSPWKPFYQFMVGKHSLDFKENIGVVAGQSGVSVTFNGGHFFNVRDEVFTEDIFAAKVVSDSVMFLADRKSNIFRTSDKGKTWSHVGPTSTYNLLPRDFYASSTGDTLIQTRQSNNNLKSFDGGVSWSNIFGGFGIGGYYDGCMAPNGKVYYAFGNYIDEVNLSNGNRTGINTIVGASGTVYGFGIEMYDNNIGYCWARDSANGDFSFYKTTDAWVNYTAMGTATGLSFASYGMPIRVHLVTEDTIYAHQPNTSNFSASSNALFYSYDGGVTWSHDTIKNSRYGTQDQLQDIHFFDGKTFIATFGSTIYLNKVTGSGGNGGPTGIESILLENRLKLYPNPTSNILNIDFSSSIDQISIFDLSGKEILTQNNNGTKSIDVSGINPGTYLVRIIANNKPYSQLFIKQ